MKRILSVRSVMALVLVGGVGLAFAVHSPVRFSRGTVRSGDPFLRLSTQPPVGTYLDLHAPPGPEEIAAGGQYQMPLPFPQDDPAPAAPRRGSYVDLGRRPMPWTPRRPPGWMRFPRR